MKILHINASETGSTGKIISDISKVLYAEGHTSVLCAPRTTYASTEYLKKYATSFPLEQGVYRRLSYFTGVPYGFSPISTHKILRIIKKENPDVVHLHSINSNIVNIYTLLSFLKRHNIPIAVTNHAEFFYTGHCSHSLECDKWKTACGNCPKINKSNRKYLFDRTNYCWKKMHRGFEKISRIAFISVSPWVMSRAIESPITCKFKHYTVLNGVNTDVFNKNLSCEVNLSQKIIFHVTAAFSDEPNHLKGGKYLIELARRFKNDDVKFVVAGPSKITGQLPENVELLGKVLDQVELANWYRKSDLTVLTSKAETFGMAVAESLCCGTPVVGFCSGGSESVSIDEYSEFIKFGDIDNLEKTIRSKWLHYKNDESSLKISESANQKYASTRMAQEYLNIYKTLISEYI